MSIHPHFDGEIVKYRNQYLAIGGKSETENYENETTEISFQTEMEVLEANSWQPGDANMSLINIIDGSRVPNRKIFLPIMTKKFPYY